MNREQFKAMHRAARHDAHCIQQLHGGFPEIHKEREGVAVFHNRMRRSAHTFIYRARRPLEEIYSKAKLLDEAAHWSIRAKATYSTPDRRATARKEYRLALEECRETPAVKLP